MRPSSLLPWIAALSATAFLGSVLLAVLVDVLLSHIGGYPYGKENMLTTFRSVFPAALVATALIGLPIAFAYTAPRKVAWIAATISTAVAVAFVVWAAIRLANPFGFLLVLAFVVPPGLCLLAGGMSIYLLLKLSRAVKAFRGHAAPLTFGPADWRTWLLVVVTLSPLAAYALHDTAHDYGCRYAGQGSHLALADNGAIAVDLDKVHWPRLKQILQEFGATRGLYLEGSDPWRLTPPDPLDLHLCSSGRLVIAASGWKDLGGEFRPKGDWHIGLRFYAPPSDTEWRTTAKALMAALDAEWPGIRYLAYADLGPSFKRMGGADCPTCKPKPLKVDYQHCLGDRSDVRKEVMNLAADTVDWPRLQRTMKTFGASRGMRYTGADISGVPKAEPWGTSLCSPGKLLVMANPVSVYDGRPGWRVSLIFHVTQSSGDAEEMIKAFIASLDAEWPGAVGNEPKLGK